MKKISLLLFLIAGIIFFQSSAVANVVDLIGDGDFTSGLGAWAPFADFWGVTDSSGGILNWNNCQYYTTGGNRTGATRTLNIDVSGYNSLVFKYSITPIFQSLTAPGWVGGNEYPAVALLRYTDTNGIPQILATGYSYWFDPSYSTTFSHKEAPYPTYWFNEDIDLFALAQKPKVIGSVEMYGHGWNYVGSADNVQLLAGTPAIPEPASLSLLGLGLLGLVRLKRRKA